MALAEDLVAAAKTPQMTYAKKVAAVAGLLLEVFNLLDEALEDGSGERFGKPVR